MGFLRKGGKEKMDINEAIEILKDLRKGNEVLISQEQYDALNLAIEELELKEKILGYPNNQ